ncbi:MAG TPA: SMC-Scp complex subunit ScpB [Terriglobales bacterium]|jgi:segregation and condensation protein B|nr:SMC-Scp complex subunit ScpB [Terriglobales bacterium]
MSLKAQLEAIIYAAETPVTLDNMIHLVKDSVTNGGPSDDAAVKSQVRLALEELSTDYDNANHGIEIRQVASGYRMSTKPEHHDVVRAFAKSLKPPIRLSMPALETLAVIAYKQPVTVPEISEIRGVDSGGVIATLLDRKLISTAGRKAVIGRPILYKTTREFLLRFGLKDVSELPSMEEFEKLVAESFQSDLLPVTDGDSGDDDMPKNTSGTNDAAGGKHGKPNPGVHGEEVEVEVAAVDVEVDSVSTGDGDDTGSDDGVGGQHGKPASS